MTTAFARVGFSGDYGGTYFLTQLVGSGKARELYYLSDRITADVEALLERFAVYAGDRVPGWQPPDQVALTRVAAEPVPGEPGLTATDDRPPWERPEEENGNGSHAEAPAVADWQPWQTTAAPTLPPSSARPPWEDATPDGASHGERPRAADILADSKSVGGIGDVESAVESGPINGV